MTQPPNNVQQIHDHDPAGALPAGAAHADALARARPIDLDPQAAASPAAAAPTWSRQHVGDPQPATAGECRSPSIGGAGTPSHFFPLDPPRRRLLAWCADVVLATLPELRAVPFYILPIADTGGVACGATSGVADLAMQPQLERRRQWQGRGNCVLVSPACVARELLELSRAERRRRVPSAVLGVVLHEAVHCVSQSPFAAIVPTPENVQQAHQELAAAFAGESDHTTTSVQERYHGPDFVRLCVHATHRVRRLGVDGVLASDIIGPCLELAGRSSAGLYAAALGDEPARLESLPFHEILELPAPPLFRDLAAIDDARRHVMQRIEAMP